MSSAAATRCTDCGAELAPGLLACPGCARLTHAAELTRLAAEAEAAEGVSDLTRALAAWRRATELLPLGTMQRTAIERRMQGLSAAVDGREGGTKRANKGVKPGAKAGILGAIGVALLKGKALLVALLANGKLLLLGLTKVPTLLSMLFYLRWSGGGGAGLGLGIVACIYVHEVGHVAALRRYGIDASAPMFIPGFGALVRMRQYPTDAHEEARTGLAGPLWGLVASAVAGATGALFGWPAALSVASISASINLFNLVPVWQLDGARGLRALARGERLIVAVAGGLAGVVFHEWMPLLVGAAALVRTFTSKAHPTGDRRMLLLFVALIVTHGLLARLPVPALARL
jgi:Zn-dependent protease